MTHAELVIAIRNFVERDMLLEDQAASEALIQLEKLVPNAVISDIIFYENDDASIEEMAEEALLREELWMTGGRRAVTMRRRMLMERVLADSRSSIGHQYRAATILKGLDREEPKPPTD